MSAAKGWRTEIVASRIAVAALCAVIGLAAQASESAPVAAVSPAPTPEELALIPSMDAPRLSPSGARIAYYSNHEHRRSLVIADRQTGDQVYVVHNARWRLLWFRWKDDARLLLGVRIAAGRGSFDRMVLVEPERGDWRYMLTSVSGGGARYNQDSLVSELPADPNRILIALNQYRSSRPKVWSVNLNRPNRLEKVVQQSIRGVRRMYADRQGNVRDAWGTTSNSRAELLWLKDGAGRWHNYSKLRESHDLQVREASTADLNLLYVTSNHEHKAGALYEFFVDSATFGAKIAQHEFSEVDSVWLDPRGETLEAVLFSAPEAPPVYLADWLQKLDGRLREVLPDTRNEILSNSDDHRFAIVRASASDQPPRYFLFEADSRRLSLLAPGSEVLDGKRFGRTVRYRIPARDETALDVYVTRPPAVPKDELLPYVLIPNSEAEERVDPGFNWLTQLFATQGYGVLQVNGRGSEGYGTDFQKAGDKQWGLVRQEDLTDATRWLINTGRADSKRIAIFGRRYGGYAALMGLVREPALYQCAVSLNGVTDLVTYSKLARYSLFVRKSIGRLWPDRRLLRANSPALQADSFRAPVLLVQSEIDDQVLAGQTEKMRRALEAAGAMVAYLPLYGADHNPADTVSRTRLAGATLSFLDGCLGSNRKP